VLSIALGMKQNILIYCGIMSGLKKFWILGHFRFWMFRLDMFNLYYFDAVIVMDKLIWQALLGVSVEQGRSPGSNNKSTWAPRIHLFDSHFNSLGRVLIKSIK
jgi:hypothetical protein